MLDALYKLLEYVRKKLCTLQRPFILIPPHKADEGRRCTFSSKNY